MLCFCSAARAGKREIWQEFVFSVGVVLSATRLNRRPQVAAAVWHGSIDDKRDLHAAMYQELEFHG